MTRRPIDMTGNGWSDADRMKALADVAGDFKTWKPAREALQRVRSVKTIFPQVNHATRVGGWPIERISLIHGASNHGKTAVAHGLGLSFLNTGHYYAYIDAEYTTPVDWVMKLMGEMSNSLAFQVHKPTTYEQTVTAVREFVETVVKAREKGRLPADTSALIVVDSLRKLVPERMLDKIEKSNASRSGVDGMSGRLAQYRAALNTAWLDELVPLMAHGNMGFLMVGRESEKVDATLFSEKWKVGGGQAVQFDSSLTARIERADWISVRESGHSKVVGERLRVRFRKTKIGSKDDKESVCFIHLSNGVLIPEGFDRARDVLELAKQCGAIDVKRSYYSDVETGEVLGQGDNAVVVKLTKDKEALGRLEASVEAKLAENEK